MCIIVKGCVDMENGDPVPFFLNPNLTSETLEKSPLVVFNKNCGELEVQVEYDGVDCEEAIKTRNEAVSPSESLLPTLYLTCL